ncbi:uncharacterized protein K489DRAFT_434560 [Dissoconium aciculare CBS 342.82]|uniref:Uncharacterized protein n=1 Tax=Dissoconium aciculare CBS 342.82 TaxID=1314786 RepID=A0A6J3LTX9_9PEZI|nr:uncharacterized protein K489DRAFT_434560 [Dissoconium aciculare CBS 342.82]KAF1819246.1 hypothetical protein K489DRAFT_434560 [Dissoconium aciculare CBS 342.82]
MAECNSSISRILSGGNTSPDSGNDDQGRTREDGAANLATIGWTWAERNKLTSMPHDWLMRYSLRSMGYVFWDARRLLDEWNISEVSSCTLNLIARDNIDDYRPEDSQVFVEHRFKDVPITTRMLDHRADDSIFARIKLSPEYDPYNDEICDVKGSSADRLNDPDTAGASLILSLKYASDC